MNFVAYSDSDVRAGAARLLAAISQNLPEVQEKTVDCLPLLIKLAELESDSEALR